MERILHGCWHCKKRGSIALDGLSGTEKKEARLSPPLPEELRLSPRRAAATFGGGGSRVHFCRWRGRIQAVSRRFSEGGVSSRKKWARPTSPANEPVDFSSRIQKPKPKSGHKPALRTNFVQASSWERGRPPRNLVTPGSASMERKAGKSSRRERRRRRGEVSRAGNSAFGGRDCKMRLLSRVGLRGFAVERDFSASGNRAAEWESGHRELGDTLL